MEKQEFKIKIAATPEKIWDILWGDTTYPAWTAAFSQGSRAETDWKKGSKVLFLNAENDGMVSTVAEHIPNEYMLFKHLGAVNKGVENYDSPEMKDWAGAEEGYRLQPAGDHTELTVNMDITDAYKDYFREAWPKALEAVRELAEK